VIEHDRPIAPAQPGALMRVLAGPLGAARVRARLADLGLLVGFLALYIRTAAPSVLAGDSAELQMAAPLLGVPHPTTYPLYTLLGKLATLLIPLGDPARRVTLVSVAAGALAVVLLGALARRISGSLPAGLLAALALGLAPGLWNAATIAEVYALLAALLAAQALLLTSEAGVPQTPSAAALPDAARPEPAPFRVAPLAALAGGLGATHHGLFLLTGLPLLALAVSADLWRARGLGLAALLRRAGLLGLAFGLGMLPLLYPLIQYARLGPFDGTDYGLPRHYFWGAPRSWGEALRLLGGGALSGGALRPPGLADALATLRMVVGRLWFEFGPLGCALGPLGCLALLRRDRRAGLGALSVSLGTLCFLVLLSAAVQDAPVFTLPLLLPWALWVGVGGLALAQYLTGAGRATSDQQPTTSDQGRASADGERKTRDESTSVSALTLTPSPPHPLTRSPAHTLTSALLGALLLATLVWGYTRVPHANKRHLTLFRTWGQAALQTLPPRSVVLAHWEQGMLLQYLVQVERQRPDVWVDVVEPGDEGWGPRVRRRYAGRPVFFAGSRADVAELPVELVRADPYADLFALRESYLQAP
jgi:hypothetical protein